jgi:hypothetical protein
MRSTKLVDVLKEELFNGRSTKKVEKKGAHALEMD